MSLALTRPADRYAPLYFLASLGAGGLAVTFFMYLMFWVPHPDRPVPVFEDISQAFGAGSVAMQTAIVIAILGIAVMAFTNLRLLFWNIGQYRTFVASPAYEDFRTSNAETQALAMPLAIAMSINVGFILGLVFVPGLWGIVEYLFPLALIAFALTGLLALSMITRFLRRVLTQPGSFNMEANNNFGQMMPAFAMAMVAVGFSAPAAMSHAPTTVAIGLIGSTFFASAATLWALVAAVLGLGAMLKNGVAKEAAPTLMVVVPILTVLGIMMVRQDHGLHTTFDGHVAKVETLMMLSKILTVQVLFALLGMMVLRAQSYGQNFLWGGTASPGAYALVCPGVALSVMVHFWLNKGLVANGLIEKFSAVYWGVTVIALALQVAMVVLALYLNRQHFGRRSATPVPAE